MASRVVTPEAVLLELPTAGPAARGLAKALDLVVNMMIISAVTTPLMMLVGFGGFSPVGPIVIAALAGFAYLFVLPIGMEILWRGRSIGKLAFGLKVVGVDGSRESVRQALVRGFVSVPEIFLSLGILAMVSASLSEKSQRLGDLAAGTVVIRSGSNRSATVPIAFHPPAGYEYYVRSLAVGRLHDDDFVLIRDFLLRVREFTKEARWNLALELATAIQRRTGTAVPPGTHPETWLICVASAYQLREGGLLADAAAGLAPLAPIMTVPPPKKRWRQ